MTAVHMMMNVRAKTSHGHRKMIHNGNCSLRSTCKAFDLKNNVLFTRNNVIFDTVEKMTNTPFGFHDEEIEDTDILSKNKEIAMLYALLIISCILYIIISDWLNRED